MEIKKLFGTQQESVQKAGLKKEKEALAKYEQGRGAPSQSGEDVVNFSTLARQLSQVSQVLQDDEAVRSKRVADLKAQVENGTYSVDSSDVAKSLISFARDLPPSGEL